MDRCRAREGPAAAAGNQDAAPFEDGAPRSAARKRPVAHAYCGAFSFRLRAPRRLGNRLAAASWSHTSSKTQSHLGGSRYLSAAGDVGGGVVHVPVAGPEAKPGFLGGEPQLQQTVNFRGVDVELFKELPGLQTGEARLSRRRGNTQAPHPAKPEGHEAAPDVSYRVSGFR